MSMTSKENRIERLPEWLKKSTRDDGSVHNIKRGLRRKGLHTVCEEARCPNLGECFKRGTATFLVMGPVCTRNCGFCSVASGMTSQLDSKEPGRVAEEVKALGLKHAVITSVTRDDLSDGGAAHFATIIESIRSTTPDTTIEVLTPDFQGRSEDIELVCSAKPEIFNHNVETVERLSPTIRSGAQYRRSLEVLSVARHALRDGLIKSGLMLGLGEELGEVRNTLSDMKAAGCDIVTIGQYLRPTRSALPVVQYIEPQLFDELKETGLKLGFKAVFSGPLVRSSYMADQAIDLIGR
jgi:lipoyl synthase